MNKVIKTIKLVLGQNEINKVMIYTKVFLSDIMNSQRPTNVIGVS